jgi:hypothetical protein
MPTQLTDFFRSSWKQSLVLLWMGIYIVINLFRTGGDAFIFNLNNTIQAPLALGTVFLVVLLWRQTLVGAQNRWLWLGLSLGWGLWAVAEVWWMVAALVGQEIPYPSWADFFWMLGYLPMYAALWIRIRSLPQFTHPLQMLGLGLVSLLSMGWTIFFILIPIIQSNDPAALLESALNIAYPVADFLLLVLVLRVFFTYQQGLYGQAWIWLSIGFILRAFANLVFAYANTVNLYYPDQQVNLLSTLGVDVPYNSAYLFWAIGLFLMRTLQTAYQPIAAGTAAELAPVPNTHLLVFAKGDDTVINVSHNYARVFPLPPLEGKRISEILGVSPEEAGTILRGIRATGVFQEHPFRAATRLGQEPILISGLVVSNPEQEYFGMTLLIRIFNTDYSLDTLLTENEKGIIRFLLTKTGAGHNEQAEIKHLLVTYHQALLQAFYTRIVAEGGSILADAFISELRSLARQKGWRMGIQSTSGLEVSGLSAAEVQKALPLLFETAQRFISRLVDAETVQTMVQEVRTHFSELTLTNISHFEQDS